MSCIFRLSLSLSKVHCKKTKKSSSSDHEVRRRRWYTGIPSEIIVEILSRLPVESVLRWCIRICHVWDALYEKCVVSKVLELDKPLFSFKRSSSPPHTADVAASCNGLVCFLDYDLERLSDECYKPTQILFIWNPSTTKCRRWLSPCFWIDYYGFGYDKSNDDFKLFSISSEQRTSQIYSLETGKWKRIGDFPNGNNRLLGVDGKYSNGALHWAVEDDGSNTSDDEDFSSSWMIISLDLATETYGQVSHPDQHGHDGSILGVLRKQLCVLCYFDDQRRSDIWVMEVKDSWTKLVSIPAYMPDNRGWMMMPLFISNDGTMLFQHNECGLISYDSKTGSYSEIQTDLFDVEKRVSHESSVVSPLPRHRALLTTASIRIKQSIRAICKYFVSN
uniref:F-box/kelch-repeat protein At3g23880-like n=1 Tax=Erigeron canadensis TaxID=72917 RepID=UPI001CB8DE62|nr:F-box/kelch-repeat protein At3g23880-like [Erigeron canadensis]